MYIIGGIYSMDLYRLVVFYLIEPKKQFTATGNRFAQTGCHAAGLF